MLRSGKEHLETLRDGRLVYVGSERIDDVTRHPAFSGAARTVAAIYDMKADPANREVMTYEEDGSRHSIYFLRPRSRDDLQRRMKGHRKIADLTLGMFGRSPDHVSSFVTGMAMKPDVLPAPCGYADNLLRYSALAIIVGVAVSLAPDIRLYRTFFLDEVNQDYVRTARAKGMSETRVMWVHVLRNAAIPIVTNVLLQLPGLLAGAFLIERFFGIPGIGREVILAVERSDFPIIKAVTIYVAVATMVFNLLADLLYKAIDPRVVLK